MLIVRIGARKRKKKLYRLSKIDSMGIYIWRTKLNQEFRDNLIIHGFRIQEVAQDENTRKRTTQKREKVV